MMFPKNGVLAAIGDTPLVRLNAISPEGGIILGKCEFMNPSGSVKDRSALGCLSYAYATGQLQRSQPVVEMTSGNMGAGLAMLCSSLGHPFTAVISEGNSRQRVEQMQLLGADVVSVPQREGKPGHVTFTDLRAVESRAKRLSAKLGAYYVNQFSNPGCAAIHRETTGPEIWRQSEGELDGFVAALGTGGTFAGVSKALTARDSAIQSITIRPAGMASLNATSVDDKSHIIQGTSYGFTARDFDWNTVDDVIEVTDEEVVEWRERLLREEGLFVGYSAAANVCGAAKYIIEHREIRCGLTVAAILCDSAFKYPAAV